MKSKTKKLITRMGKLGDALEDAAFEQNDDEFMSEADRLALAEELQGVVSGGMTIAGKFGFSEVWGIGLYPSAVRGEKLTAVEIIRQMLNASTEPEAFAAALRRLADKLWKSPNVCGAEALG